MNTNQFWGNMQSLRNGSSNNHSTLQLQPIPYQPVSNFRNNIQQVSQINKQDKKGVSPVKKNMLSPRTLEFAQYYWNNNSPMNEYDEEKFGAQLRCYEISEVEGKLGYFPKNNNQVLVSKCSVDEKCCFIYQWKKKNISCCWYPEKYNQHTCTKIPGQKQKMTNYPAKVLSKCISDLVKTFPKSNKYKSTRAILNMYTYACSDTLKDHYIENCYHFAEEQVGLRCNLKQMNEEIGYIEAMQKAARDVGHKMNIHTTTIAKQREIIIKKAKKEHSEKNKELSKESRNKFKVEDDIFDCLKHLNENDKILYGYTFVPEHGKRMIQTLKTVYASDGAHMKWPGDWKGTVFGTWGQDANNQMVLVGVTVLFDNESSDTWEIHLLEMKNEYGDHINSKNNYMIADGDKGFIDAKKKCLEKINYFTCCIHREKNIMKNSSLKKSK